MIRDFRGTHGVSQTEFVIEFHSRQPRAPAIKADLAKVKTAPAYVNHGRWVVDCPDCNGAELVDLDDPRLMCMSCWNAGINGRWRPVQLPAQRDKIEGALMERKQETSRNWLPGESVIDLLAQTLEREG